jgi:toxin ParE1/3/4
MVQLKWTLIAIDDLRSIYEFIARDSKKFAKIEVIKIKLRTKVLKDKPFIGKQVRERNDSRIRELIEGNYRIIYKVIDDKRIDILTIHHGTRDLKRRELE